VIRIPSVLGEGVVDCGSTKGTTGCRRSADDGFSSLSLSTSARLWPGAGVGGRTERVGRTMWGSPSTGEAEAVWYGGVEGLGE
jgi:hypothetical protein